MKMLKFAALASGAVLSLAVTATPAQAQATRTWVSGVGDDVNPCSRTAPCKTFAGAISKTAAGGEINCLDPAGYGAINITKSITIDCEDTQGSILAANVNGVIVNGAGAKVVLRGLSINGANTTTGNGIRFIQGAALVVEELFIQNHAGTTTNGSGILFQPSTAAELYVTNSSLVNGGNTGIELAPAVGGSVKAVIRNVHVNNYATNGIRLNSASGEVLASITSSEIGGNANGVVVSATSNANLLLLDSDVSSNSGFGILASGAQAKAAVGNTTITNNGTGVSLGGGALVNSYGDNHLNRNVAADGAFTPGVVAKL